MPDSPSSFPPSPVWFPSSQAASPPSHGRQKSPLFALLIGINLYQSTALKTLHGAVPDALAWKAYLEDFLGLPEDQIILLLNEKATSSNIIEAFQKLAIDSRIQQGDPIVIFYAGHGTEREVIQMLVPHDFSSVLGNEVAPIPDRQIERLIGNIASEKGDNITVIFDCCHSASGTRGLDNEHSTSVVRSVKIDLAPFNFDLDLDTSQESGFRGGKIQSHDARPAGLQSHMLIAACGASEQAKESNGHGNFSKAFLDLLRTHPPDQLRYCDILTQMDAISGQNPQCEGRNRDRILFNAKVVRPSRGFPIGIKQIDGSGAVQLGLEAGSAHGITEGAQFAVYLSDETAFEKPLAHITINSVAAFSALTEYLPDFPTPTTVRSYVAIQTKTGQKEDFRLFIPPDDEFRAIYKSVQEENAKFDLHNIVLVDNSTIAHLQASMINGEAMFEMKDERVLRYGFTRQFNPINAADSEHVASVLSGIAHFYRELNRANSDPKVTGGIHVEFYKLEYSSDDLVPVGSNLCQNHTIDFVIEEDAPYGINLINNTNHDFYPYLFYFDMTDLSITDYYHSSLATPYACDIPLKQKNGTLTLGYGFGGGVDPFSYFLNDKQDLDVGFLKLFVSTRPIDLEYVRQPSPFDSTRGNKKWNGKKDTWDTVLIPMVQRRYKSVTSV